MWAVLPARLASTRLPRKVLADLGGRTVLERVWRRVVAAGCFDQVWIATSDEEVHAAARAFGAEVVPTPDARNGTHRVALAVRELGHRGPVVNVQADQPFVDPEHLVRLCELLERGAEVATLAAPLLGDPTDPARVKVYRTPRIWFSRRVLGPAPHEVHVGLYGFGAGRAEQCAAAPLSSAARNEDLEQLAWIDAGIDVRVGAVSAADEPIDTPADLERARRRLLLAP